VKVLKDPLRAQIRSPVSLLKSQNTNHKGLVRVLKVFGKVCTNVKILSYRL